MDKSLCVKQCRLVVVMMTVMMTTMMVILRIRWNNGTGKHRQSDDGK